MALSQLLLSVLIATASGVKLPFSFTKCDWKQSDCLTKSVESAISQLTSPMKDVNVPSMDPLDIPKMLIGAGTGAVAFQQNYKSMKVSGFSKINCSQVAFDSVTNKLKMDCLMPTLRLDFDYEIKGKILLLPIYGQGPGSILLDQARFVIIFDLREKDKKGVKHLEVVKTQVAITSNKINFDLKNLFDGDTALGGNVLQVMNDNWKEVYADVQPGYQQAFGTIFASVFNNLLDKVPVSELRND